MARPAFDADCERYNALIAAGWQVLRFTWWHVMKQPPYVEGLLEAVATGGPPGRTEVVAGRPRRP